MGETVVTVETWRIEYTDAGTAELAKDISDELRQGSATVPAPEYKPPVNAKLGTPEVIITILVTAAAKAVVISGLHALQRYLESRTGSTEEKRLQVVLAAPGDVRKRFPLSLREIGNDAIKEFVSRIIMSVDHLSL